MRIGIDARLYFQTGVGRYIRNLISELALIDKRNEYYIYLRKTDFLRFIPPNRRWKKKLLDIPWHSLKEQLFIPFILLRDKIDVAHFPYFTVPIFCSKKYLLTIHDLIVDHFDTGKASTLPKFIYKLKRLAYKAITFVGIKRARKITAISQTTKQEILDHYSVSSSKVIVTYDALDANFLKIATAKKSKFENYLKHDYILYVGNAYPHKNLERLISAFSLLRQKREIKLVLAGDDNYFYPRLKRYVARRKLAKDVVFFGYANDMQLVGLYTHAKCLVFPSLMEGFGLPNIEAVFCNTLPVVSDIPAFREIWGGKVTYFSPCSFEDIADKIIKVIDLSPREHQEMVEIAKMKIRDFSWKKTAKETLKIYEQIYNNV